MLCGFVTQYVALSLTISKRHAHDHALSDHLLEPHWRKDLVPVVDEDIFSPNDAAIDNVGCLRHLGGGPWHQDLRAAERSVDFLNMRDADTAGNHRYAFGRAAARAHDEIGDHGSGLLCLGLDPSVVADVIECEEIDTPSCVLVDMM